MANELGVSVQLSYQNGSALLNGSFSATVSVSAVPAIQSVVNIGTTDETLVLGDVSTIGFVLLKNLDATNYISFGSDGTNYPIKLKAGECALIRWNAAAIHAKANAASCNLEYAIISD